MRPTVALLSVAAFTISACRAEPAAEPEVPNAAAPVQPAAPASPPEANAQADFPKLEGRVVDRASLLSTDQEAALTQELTALQERTGDQMVVVTVPSLGGRPIADYARELGNHWGIGQAERDNGVLFVVAPAERQTRIAVGYGLEPILTEDRTKQIIDEALLPSFREERWHDGIQAGTRAIADVLVAHAGESRRGR
jgi:uncharacterized protein